MAKNEAAEVVMDEDTSLVELARAHVPRAIQVLANLLESPSEKTRLMAAVVILDRAELHSGPKFVGPKHGRALLPPAKGAEAKPFVGESGTKQPAVKLAPRDDLTPVVPSSAAQKRAADRKRILETIEADPDKTWTSPEIARGLNIKLHDASLLMLQLCNHNAIKRMGAGMYKAR